MDHFLEDHIPSYQMGITVWSCALYGKSNGRVWSEMCIRDRGMADRILIMKDGKINGEFLRSPDLKDTDLIDNMI